MKASAFLLTGILLVLVFPSCKKEQDNTPVTTSVSCGSSSTITACPGASYYAILSHGKSGWVTGGSVSTTSDVAEAYFSSSATTWPNTSTYVLVDTVKLNAAQMKFDTLDNSYHDTLGISSGGMGQIPYPLTWEVAGNNGIPSFTFTDNGPFPGYSGYNQLPDTIDPAQGFSFQLSGISNSGEITIMAFDGVSKFAFKINPASSGTITFSASELAGFSSGSTGLIQVSVIKHNTQNVYGKMLDFSSSYTLFKYVYIQ
jgi:hypothetical protein